MKLLIVLAFLKVVSAQNPIELLCGFQWVDGLYTCNLVIDNPNGRDNHTEITTTPHLPGMTDANVQQILTVSGISTNFPTILCKTFINTRTIRARNIGIEMLSENSFVGCPNLQNLDLYNNSISTIEEGTFRIDSLLEILILSRNQLSFNDSQSATLQNLQQLFYLGLDNNPLGDLPSTFFRTLIRLQTLELHSASLLILRPQWFENLVQLRSLQLYNNFISEIPENSFKNLLLLTSLQLDRNLLQTLSSSAFPCRMQNLQTLNLNDNQIEAVDLEIFNRVMNLRTLNFDGNNCLNKSFGDFQLNRDANLDEFADCFEGFERVLEDKNACRPFDHPDFGYTCEFKDETFTDGAFDIYRIHKNCLTDFDVTGVIFRSSQIAKIPEEVFKIFPNLVSLKAENVKLETVPTAECGSNIKFIDFGHNSIRTLTSDAFSGCQKVEEIILDNNCIGRVQECEQTFVENLKTLKSLSMLQTTCVDEKFDITRLRIEQVEAKLRKCFKNWYFL